MQRFAAGLLFSLSLLTPAFAANPFLGRWDFNITTPRGTGAAWLGVKQNAGNIEVWYQPTGGNVFLVKEAKIDGSHLSMTVSQASADRPAVTWELDAGGDKLTGVQKRGDVTTPLTGVRAPDLKRSAPKAWAKAEPLFNGKNLDGWEPMGADSHWVVRDGLLVNEDKGANLKSTRKFDDFKLHFEVFCPAEHANSGFYLRGRYEVQLASVNPNPKATGPKDRGMGAIYGRLAPARDADNKSSGWDVFDITFVGRTVTIVRNGVTIHDRQEIEGITGGALDANEGEPGPFYIQGDHTGGLKFRNITISAPAK